MSLFFMFSELSSGHGNVRLLLPTETSCDTVKHLENIRLGINYMTSLCLLPKSLFFVGFVDSSDCISLNMDTFLLLAQREKKHLDFEDEFSIFIDLFTTEKVT